jgi:hypothetical protein
MGPWAYLQHLASTPRLPFTAAYFGSLGLTLYFSVGVSLSMLSGTNGVNTEAAPAPKHNSHALCWSHSTRFPHLVSDQLLPDGLQRAAPCKHLWRSQGSSLDDRLNGHASLLATYVFLTTDVFLRRHRTVHDVNGYTLSTQTLDVPWSP